ncbi:hypothetical protein D9M71_702290 [compost metagenome]
MSRCVEADHADLQTRRLERQLEKCQSKPKQHSRQQVSEDDRQRRRRIGEHRHPSIAAQTTKRLEVDQFDAGINQHTRQARHRDLLQHAAEHYHKCQQPHPMQNR